MKSRFLVQLRFLVGFEEADAGFWKYSITWKAAIASALKQSRLKRAICLQTWLGWLSCANPLPSQQRATVGFSHVAFPESYRGFSSLCPAALLVLSSTGDLQVSGQLRQRSSAGRSSAVAYVPRYEGGLDLMQPRTAPRRAITLLLPCCWPLDPAASLHGNPHSCDCECDRFANPPEKLIVVSLD